MPHLVEELARTKPRGNRSGLILRQEESVRRTYLAIGNAWTSLAASKPNEVISEIELCRLAGLKSTIPLHSTPNAATLDLLDRHNRRVRELARNTPEIAADDISAKDQLIVRLDAEVSHLLRQNARLRRQLKAARGTEL